MIVIQLVELLLLLSNLSVIEQLCWFNLARSLCPRAHLGVIPIGRTAAVDNDVVVVHRIRFSSTVDQWTAAHTVL